MVIVAEHREPGVRNCRSTCDCADAINDIPGHFASVLVGRLRRVLRDRYEIACDDADVVRTLKGSSAAEYHP